jgi:hypothetical protein
MDGRERMGERRERPAAGFRRGDGGAAIAGDRVLAGALGTRPTVHGFKK